MLSAKLWESLYKSSTVILKQAKTKNIMFYLVDFRAQVIKSVEQQDMSIRQACAFYDISKATLQNWLKDPSIKQTRYKSLTKILNEAHIKRC